MVLRFSLFKKKSSKKDARREDGGGEETKEQEEAGEAPEAPPETPPEAPSSQEVAVVTGGSFAAEILARAESHGVPLTSTTVVALGNAVIAVKRANFAENEREDLQRNQEHDQEMIRSLQENIVRREQRMHERAREAQSQLDLGAEALGHAVTHEDGVIESVARGVPRVPPPPHIHSARTTQRISEGKAK